MAITYADSGLGWIADERFFAYDPGVLCKILGLNYSKTATGSVVFATVYLPHLGTTGPVVLSTVQNYAEYTDGRTNVKSQGSIDYIGRTWYITAFTGFQQGDRNDTSGTSQKLTVDSSSLYDIGAAILDAATVSRKPRDPTQKKSFHIEYQGSSKVIRRICERLNNVALLGTEHNEAFYGDWGNDAYLHSQKVSGNPHNVSLEDLGIANLPRQMEMVLESIGAIDMWIDYDMEQSDYIYMADHEDNIFVFRSTSNLLAWH